MLRHASRQVLAVVATLGVVALAACNDNGVTNVVLTTTPFAQTNLVSDRAGFGAVTVDPLLVNPWGIAFGSNSVLWVSNNGSGTATTYSPDGVKQSLSPAIGTPTAQTGGVPTGVVFNPTNDFLIPGDNTALFIFGSEDGTISAWGSTTGPANVSVVANRSAAGSVYKAVAIGTNNGAVQLYATDFRNGNIDVFDNHFNYITSFNDPSIPAGFAPFGIANIAGKLVVTYAKQLLPDKVEDEAGIGNGFVNVFNTDGTLDRRFASNGSLDSPWGMAVAPAGFGNVGGSLLIGNFGNGTIGVYDITTGAFLGLLRNTSNAPLTIDGLWGLQFGPGAAANVLYFSAGTQDETHGLVGVITPQ